MENIRTFKPYKVRRVEGFSNRYQVCMYGLIDGVDVLPGFFDTVSSAQEFADVLNDINKEVQLHV